MWTSGCLDDNTDETPVDVIYSDGASAWIRPAILPDELGTLALMVGNGIDGDLRLEGNTSEAIALARGLLIGTGACRRSEAPAAGVETLYRDGDECYHQHAEGRAFLNPIPTGAVVRREAARLTQPDPVWVSMEFEITNRIEPTADAWTVGRFSIPRATGSMDRTPMVWNAHRDGHVLWEGATLHLLPFQLKDGGDAVLVVLRLKWKDVSLAWARSRHAHHAQRLVDDLNAGIRDVWKRWRASPSFAGPGTWIPAPKQGA